MVSVLLLVAESCAVYPIMAVMPGLAQTERHYTKNLYLYNLSIRDNRAGQAGSSHQDNFIHKCFIDTVNNNSWNIFVTHLVVWNFFVMTKVVMKMGEDGGDEGSEELLLF